MKYRSSFLRDDRGATAIEYGLIAALISVVIIGALGATGGGLMANYTNWTSAVGAALGN